MFYFIGYFNRKIEDKDFLQIPLLYIDRDSKTFVIKSAFVKDTIENKTTLDKLDNFADVTRFVTFKVRRDGNLAISLNIN